MKSASAASGWAGHPRSKEAIAIIEKLKEALEDFVYTDENGVRKSSPQQPCEALAMDPESL